MLFRSQIRPILSDIPYLVTISRASFVACLIKLHTDGSGWVANFDWFEFGEPIADVDKSQLQAKYDENVALLQEYDKYHYVGF